ncbi:MAG: hypothetical protein QGG80_04995 [Candidatus Krumholzibacteria bacterium]|jgi:flagellar motility protein MotE (MotC chaperone)|nr:hypothetical protein [Candidatus Krumholzibacteria bacterium]MDP6796618.1 hypothetical protein [Candidatus Krumholzibacteria bacterium]MDP7020952.1 hypothetical protein [Candidatus Krumholzibacteria bacterium]
MKSVILFSIFSFFVVFALTFWIAGVFGGNAGEEAQLAETREDPLDEMALASLSLKARESQVKAREKELRVLRDAIEMEKSVLSEEFQKLSDLRRQLELSVSEMEVSKLRSVRKLARVYESMPPREAASILSGMDLEIVLAVIREMKERQAAKVMASLDPARAAALSSMMGAMVAVR